MDRNDDGPIAAAGEPASEESVLPDCKEVVLRAGHSHRQRGPLEPLGERAP